MDWEGTERSWTTGEETTTANQRVHVPCSPSVLFPLSPSLLPQVDSRSDHPTTVFQGEGAELWLKEDFHVGRNEEILLDFCTQDLSAHLIVCVHVFIYLYFVCTALFSLAFFLVPLSLGLLFTLRLSLLSCLLSLFSSFPSLYPFSLCRTSAVCLLFGCKNSLSTNKPKSSQWIFTETPLRLCVHTTVMEAQGQAQTNRHSPLTCVPIPTTHSRGCFLSSLMICSMKCMHVGSAACWVVSRDL